MSEKELLFDSFEEVKKAFSHFQGYFMLGYTKWLPKLVNSMSIEENYRLDLKDNVYPITAYVILKLVQQFYERNKRLFENK